ncbi:MAG: hypothetical protein U0175_29850 [Caldilineaceae bacterium]
MAIYSLYGLRIHSTWPFITPLAQEGTGEADLSFCCLDEAPLTVDWDSQQPLCSSPHLNGEGASIWAFYRLATCDVVRCPRIGDFYLWPTQILCHRCPIDAAEQVAQKHWIEIRLLGTVLAFWLEQRGIPVLHAAAVATPQGAIAFVADSGCGKSTLASAFVRAGYPLLTDDNLAIRQGEDRFWALPGYPQMRMWPATATYAVGDYQDLPPLFPDGEKRRLRIGKDGFGHFHTTAQALSVCYLPERRDPAIYGSEVEIEPLSPAQALYALVQHSFLFEANQRLGNHGRRLQFWSQFVRQIAVKRLYYPDDFASLERVRQVILADIASNAPCSV